MRSTMHVSPVSGRLLRGAAVFALALSSGCGGGSGGGGGGGTSNPPGVLAALALEGQVAPGTGGSTFLAFGPATRVDSAEGGWTAFAADAFGGTSNGGLFVARPDGSITEVFVRGETVPSPGTGTINQLLRIWMRPNGVVVAHVAILGGSGEGILSARVPTSGAVVEKAAAIYLGTTLPAGARGSGAPGALSALDSSRIEVDDDGDVFFVGVGSGGTPLHGVWTVARGGTGLTAVSVTGDTAPGGGSIGFDIDALGIDGAGVVVAYACDILSGPTHAIVASTSPSLAGILVSQDGSTPPSVGSRTFENVYDAGPLYVTYDSGVSFVTWQGDLTGSTPDRGVFTRQVLSGNVLSGGPLQSIAVPGMSVPGVGAGAFAADIRLLRAANGPNRVPIQIDVAGGTTSRVIVSAPNAVTLTQVVRQGQTIPPPANTTFTGMFGSLQAPGTVISGDRFGSLAFSADLADFSSGVYWAILGDDFYQVARQGGSAPGTGGGTFGPLGGPGSVVPTSTSVVFAASVNGGTAASGLFRQQ